MKKTSPPRIWGRIMKVYLITFFTIARWKRNARTVLSSHNESFLAYFFFKRSKAGPARAALTTKEILWNKF
jgi:hypothetical protein